MLVHVLEHVLVAVLCVALAPRAAATQRLQQQDKQAPCLDARFLLGVLGPDIRDVLVTYSVRAHWDVLCPSATAQLHAGQSALVQMHAVQDKDGAPHVKVGATSILPALETLGRVEHGVEFPAAGVVLSVECKNYM